MLSFKSPLAFDLKILYVEGSDLNVKKPPLGCMESIYKTEKGRRFVNYKFTNTE
jgi:hypothetical protein